MSLGTGAYKVGGAGQCSSTRKEVSMATLRAMPTRHRHTELFSGILTDQILNWSETKMGGRAGKKTLHKNGNQGKAPAKYTLQRPAGKQLQIQAMRCPR